MKLDDSLMAEVLEYEEAKRGVELSEVQVVQAAEMIRGWAPESHEELSRVARQAVAIVLGL